MLQTLVPAEDEAIGSALAELDTKLSAWVAAVAAAQEALVERSTARVSSASHRLSLERAALSDEAADELSSSERDDAGLMPRSGNLDPGQVEAGPPADETAEPVKPAKPVRPPSSGTRGIVSYVTAEPGPSPEAVAQQASKDRSTEDDEALLANLDEETVSALRMMRRLSTVKRSMRELLAEYQAEQGMKPDEAPTPARTSWWKRK